MAVKPYTKNPKIVVNGASLSSPSAVEAWESSTFVVLDKIYSSKLGEDVLKMIEPGLEIIPWYNPANPLSADSWAPGDVVPNSEKNDFCRIRFTAETWAKFGANPKPGMLPDEVLFHEIIHTLDDFAKNYKNPIGSSFEFSKADFLTVNATNVYARRDKAPPRKLRKDHGEDHFAEITPMFDQFPVDHEVFFRNDYRLAHKNSEALFKILSESNATWNPFKEVSAHPWRQWDYKVKSKDSIFEDWQWVYSFFSDNRARWVSLYNRNSFGVGTWVDDGKDRRVTWKTGGWDLIPKSVDDGTARTGSGQNAGVSYKPYFEKGLPVATRRPAVRGVA
jgi:hypothetical protein